MRLARTVCVVILLVSVSGCLGVVGDSSSFERGSHEAVFERTTDSMDEETADAFEDTILADGEATPRGTATLDRLLQVEDLGANYRDAVARSIADEGEVDAETVAALDRVLASPEGFQMTVFAEGATDSTGDGLLDGETQAFGLDPETPHPDVAELAATLGREGYSSTAIEYIERVGTLTDRTVASDIARQRGADGVDENDLAYLDRVAELTENEFTRAQVRAVAPIQENADADLRTLEDASGDGLLTGMAERLGLDPAVDNADVAAVARQLSEGGYDDAELAFLDRLGDRRDQPFAWQQLQLTLDGMVANGTVTEEDTKGLADTSGDGLLTATAEHLGLDPRETHPELAALAEQFATDGFESVERDYLERAATVKDDPFAWRQVQRLESVAFAGEGVSQGNVSTADIQQFQDSSGDGLLDTTAREFGLPVDERHPDLVDRIEPLLLDEFGATEEQYLNRVVEIYESRGHSYGYWEQATEAGLVHEATAGGTVTERQRWALGNDDGDRLLNGLEVELGTDPERADTSGDGYADHLKWGPMADLGLNVTADEVDVFVELDTAANVSVPDDGYASLDAVAEAFDSGEGVPPVNVHFRQCHTDGDSIGTLEGMQAHASDSKEITGLGFHYLFVNDGRVVDGDSTYKGYTRWSSYRTSWMVVNADLGDRDLVNTIAHELGHKLGVHPADFDGVDSYEYSVREYNSVMNYNLDIGLTFSTGEPYDDYEGMADSKFGSSWESHDALDRMWEEGAVEEDALC